MNKITSLTELRESIRLLEIKQLKEAQLLKTEFKITIESFKPANLIKSTFDELTTTPDLKGDIINTTLSLIVGFLSKKAIVGKTKNPVIQLLGTFLQMGVTSLVSKNNDGIRTTISYLVNNILNKKETTS